MDFCSFSGSLYLCCGSDFNYDKKDFLTDKIEHTKPDYNLYHNFTDKSKYYSNHSIGFTTRFCFRQCEWCVNRNKTKVVTWNSLDNIINAKFGNLVFELIKSASKIPIKKNQSHHHLRHLCLQNLQYQINYLLYLLILLH